MRREMGMIADLLTSGFLTSAKPLPPIPSPTPLPPCSREWRKSEPHMRREMGMIAAHAAWHMGHWDEMSVYVDTVDSHEVPQSQVCGGELGFRGWGVGRCGPAA